MSISFEDEETLPKLKIEGVDFQLTTGDNFVACLIGIVPQNVTGLRFGEAVHGLIANAARPNYYIISGIRWCDLQTDLLEYAIGSKEIYFVCS